MTVSENLATVFNKPEQKDILETIQHFLANNKDFSGYKHGDKKALDNDISVIFLQAQSGAKNKALLEAHRRLCDLHYTLTGTDTIAWKLVSDCSNINTNYTEEGDYLLYDELPAKSERVEPGNFCFIPNEFAHMALYDDGGTVSKLVFKIPATVL